MARAALARLRPDPYITALLCTVLFATVLPARGLVAQGLDHLTEIAIALLFFLYGARLSTRDTIDGMRHWRLHLTVFACTFAVFPLLGLAAHALVPGQLSAGVVYLCALPSTVQSSIAFTSTARGNIAAAICSASLSSLLGIVLTPLLVGTLLRDAGGAISLDSLVSITVQLLIPFLAGQVARRWIGDWMQRHTTALGRYDRGSILLIVYTAFSEGVVSGIWDRLAPAELATLLIVEVGLLAIVLALTGFGSRLLGFDSADRVAIVFCGSKKSLATGLPMANVLFAPHVVGMIVLPVMLFHQLQLIVCAAIARRLAGRGTTTPATPPEHADEPELAGQRQ